MNDSSVCCVFALDDNYVTPFKVFFNSLSATGSIPPSVPIAIIHSGSLSNQSKEDIRCFLHKHSKSPEYFNAAGCLPQNLPLRDGDHVSDATFYRLFIADLLPCKWDKAVYLDVDMIAVKNVSYLFDIEVESMIAAADHLSPEDSIRLWGETCEAYFQAGVIVIPLKKWRDCNISRQFLDILNKYSTFIKWWDQDVLNIAFKDDWDRLPIWSNISWTSMRFIPEVDLMSQTGIRHFTGPDKPWNSLGEPPFVDLWDRNYQEVFLKQFERSNFEASKPPLLSRLIPGLKSRIKYLILGII